MDKGDHGAMRTPSAGDMEEHGQCAMCNPPWLSQIEAAPDCTGESRCAGPCDYRHSPDSQDMELLRLQGGGYT